MGTFSAEAKALTSMKKTINKNTTSIIGVMLKAAGARDRKRERAALTRGAPRRWPAAAEPMAPRVHRPDRRA